MSALGRYYRFIMQNNTGVAWSSNASFGVSATRYRYDPNGTLTFETSQDWLISGNASLASGGYATGTSVTNVAAQWIGGTFMCQARPTASTGASPSGTVAIFISRSTDGTQFDDTSKAELVHLFELSSSDRVWSHFHI